MPKVTIVLTLLLLLFASPSVYAQESKAILTLKPSTGSFAVGKSFTTAIRLNAGGNNIGSAQVYLIFPTENLEVSSISKTGSVSNFFVEEPTFDNVTGTIRMTADFPSPGFTGSDGLIATITFKAKGSGNANVGFSTESAVFTTSGTSSVLATPDSATYTVTGGTVSVTPTAAVTEELTPTEEASGSGTPLPNSATTSETVIGILIGMAMIASAFILKLTRRSV